MGREILSRPPLHQEDSGRVQRYLWSACMFQASLKHVNVMVEFYPWQFGIFFMVTFDDNIRNFKGNKKHVNFSRTVTGKTSKQINPYKLKRLCK